jgi:hypothetical protein
MKHNIFVRVITMVILLGILAVLAYLLYEKKMAERDQNASIPTRQLAFDLDARTQFS